MKYLMFLLGLFLLTSCGAVKSSKNKAINWFVDKYKKEYPQDNEIEEKVESYVNDLIGLDLDFTPESPETIKEIH